jgi:hypothetical protein
MHEATWWTGLWVSIAVWTITAAGGGCRGTGQESAATNAEQSEVSEHSAEKPKKLKIAGTVLTSPAVFAGQELGMTLSGPGESGRSLAGLEHAIQTFLPQLQAVYVDELQQEPSLMGSLEVKLTIEANGTVSDLRFPHVRLSGQRFKTAIFDHMRAWVFPQAAKQVQLRYRLLFVPAGIDYTAILTWESYLNGQAGTVGRGKPLRIVTAPDSGLCASIAGAATVAIATSTRPRRRLMRLSAHRAVPARAAATPPPAPRSTRACP